MCFQCGSCDHEPVYSIDDAADWIYNDTLFGRTKKNG